MRLDYTITFLDYWHTGSGLSGGAELDSSVLKDENSLPYLSGKTIKGLVREMAESLEYDAFVKSCFGEEGGSMGVLHFSNAILDEDEQKEIVSHSLQNHLYTILSATKLEHGIAVSNSLREIEVVVPLTLYASIQDIPSEDDYKKITQALKYIKRLGANRHRGLGRCLFQIGEKR